MPLSRRTRWLIFLVAVAIFAGVSVVAFRDSTNGPPLPGSILDLSNWKLQLPIDERDEEGPDEVKQPLLNRYRDKFFYPNQAGDGVVFRAHAGGSVTEGSSFARTELREMADDGRTKASWSSQGSTHTMTIRLSIDALPKVRPSIAVGQVHGGNRYGALVRLDGTRLYVKSNDKNQGDLHENYKLGTVFELMFQVSGNRIRVYYNTVMMVELEYACRTCYFKAGAYLQTNIEWGDHAEAIGQVTIYDLSIKHSKP